MPTLLSFVSISVFGVDAIPIYSNGRLFVFVQGIVFCEGAIPMYSDGGGLQSGSAL